MVDFGGDEVSTGSDFFDGDNVLVLVDVVLRRHIIFKSKLGLLRCLFLSAFAIFVSVGWSHGCD